MKKIENEDGRLITFSKRTPGIYRKVSELVTLTVSAIARLVFSQSGKPFSFGNPSIEAVANRFLGLNCQMRKRKETQPRWWETPVYEFNHQELLQMDATIDNLSRTFIAKLNEKTAAASSSAAPPMYFHHGLGSFPMQFRS
ncbi:Agamous-like MADS-box protein AGL61 [Citrus sinensis]|uniref:Agamous-like MADS-box protein AGL61 n=1 Tax=Citrus sinensis TaxID=2711 RepID=A0ACB8HYJ6_CITSI|nr:Agamous-like MADS-box protein AGL61 [Citrus sinensis]